MSTDLKFPFPISTEGQSTKLVLNNSSKKSIVIHITSNFPAFFSATPSTCLITPKSASSIDIKKLSGGTFVKGAAFRVILSQYDPKTDNLTEELPTELESLAFPGEENETSLRKYIADPKHPHSSFIIPVKFPRANPSMEKKLKHLFETRVDLLQSLQTVQGKLHAEKKEIDKIAHDKDQEEMKLEDIRDSIRRFDEDGLTEEVVQMIKSRKLQKKKAEKTLQVIEKRHKVKQELLEMQNNSAILCYALSALFIVLVLFIHFKLQD
eukprot:gnl/Carplike_NY0171/9217_a12852_125.p1 GENE.gnl/Carplike_NY0171/9217_a12852_125~~gnl/Carplike_NY0171/9217_a12852_125.p1  ORF type:complete len:266 (+),score=49.39 gnl/Carplike_NY0171/9217_a12852_125:180-977(+)